jgi:hypothetical protein
MLKLFAGIALSLFATSYAHASAKCESLKGLMAAELSEACGSSTELTKQQIELFKSGIDTLVNECGESDFADSLYRGVLFKKMGLPETCKARAKILSHATGLNEA